MWVLIHGRCEGVGWLAIMTTTWRTFFLLHDQYIKTLPPQTPDSSTNHAGDHKLRGEGFWIRKIRKIRKKYIHRWMGRR